MNDILPEEIGKWHFVEDTTRRIFDLYGFAELRSPILEKTELFLRGIGEDTDVVEKQMYTFSDKSGALITLRPEATASVVRAVIEHGLLGKDPIQKLYSLGPMFRYERPQKGRYRQFHQINVERLGEEGPYCDSETLAMAYELATALDLNNVSLEVNSLGCASCRKTFKHQLQIFLENKQAALCEDCSRRMHTNPLRVLDCKTETCQQVVAQAPSIEDFLCDDCRGHYHAVLEGLRSLQVPYTRNARLVRGLDYYTRTTFELTASGLGSQNAIAGGGRYDGLISTLGGPDVPGIGFAFGIERIIMLLEGRTEDVKGCYVVIHGDEHLIQEALKLLSDLRSADLKAEAVLEKSFKAQMRRAGKSDYPVCAILGEDEIARGVVTLKDLRTSFQTQVPRSEVAKKVYSLLEE